MKHQTGFISSSSSVTITYATRTSSKLVGYSDLVSATTKTQEDISYGASHSKINHLQPSSKNMNLLWKTYESTSYQRIESFLEAVEKLNTPYSKTTKTYFPLSNFAEYIDERNIYNGFVDVVITFPCKIRLAGIELLNPWVNKYTNDVEASYWRYLPSRFSIFKVNDELKNNSLKNMTYEDDIAKTDEFGNDKPTFRPVRYDNIESDDRMIFLGRYEVNWETTPSYKCFFKFNENDKASVNVENSSSNAGTATWECKQLVLRIFKTKMSSDIITGNNITEKIAEYIADKETELGTTIAGKQPTPKDVFNRINFFIAPDDPNCPWANYSDGEKGTISCDINGKITGMQEWKFGSHSKRRYDKVGNVKFPAGLEYKLGGIQLLLSPDIFCISEMKMYNYANLTNNKVFIGEWNKDHQGLEYYGAGTLKSSPMIDVSNVKANAITWKHNFNIPPKYLDAKVYVKFKVDFDSFYAGDVVSNLVNADKEPLTMRITGTDITLNISNGICFTNPETGEFLQFKNGFGIQHDREGEYDALKAARAVGAPVLKAQSIVASKIEAIDPSKGNAYPFEIYFVVKRLF